MTQVVIVGAGPAGAGLAYLLSRHGVPVTLLERRRDFSREFRGEVLMPSGIAALEQMGLGPQLARLPSCAQQQLAVYLNRRPVFSETLGPEASGRAGVLAVSQPALLEMLVAESGASSCFTLIRGASLKALVQQHGRVCGVRVRVGGQELTLEADLVVGADGRNSAVRRQLGIPARNLGVPMDIVWCKVPCPEKWRGVRAFAGRGHLLVAYRTWDGSLQLGWVILKDTFGELRSRGIERWVDEMANHVDAEFGAHLRAHAAGIARPFLLDTVADRVLRWSVPGALLIGDAAHTMSPVAGQGVNIALRDTIVAANHLVPVLSAPRLDTLALNAAAQAVEAERLPEVREIQKLQSQPPRLLLSRAWWGEPVRRLAGALLSRAAVRRRAGGQATSFFRGVSEVQLRLPVPENG